MMMCASADVDNRVDVVGRASRPIPSNTAAVRADCSASLEQSINELQLMRIELRGRDVISSSYLLTIGTLHGWYQDVSLF